MFNLQRPFYCHFEFILNFVHNSKVLLNWVLQPTPSGVLFFHYRNHLHHLNSLVYIQHCPTGTRKCKREFIMAHALIFQTCQLLFCLYFDKNTALMLLKFDTLYCGTFWCSCKSIWALICSVMDHLCYKDIVPISRLLSVFFQTLISSR